MTVKRDAPGSAVARLGMSQHGMLPHMAERQAAAAIGFSPRTVTRYPERVAGQ